MFTLRPALTSILTRQAALFISASNVANAASDRMSMDVPDDVRLMAVDASLIVEEIESWTAYPLGWIVLSTFVGFFFLLLALFVPLTKFMHWIATGPFNESANDAAPVTGTQIALLFLVVATIVLAARRSLKEGCVAAYVAA